MHNFLDTCSNEASEESIGIYVKRYGVLKLLGLQTPIAKGKYIYVAPTLGRETKGFLMVG